jgi:hypothetical protein
VRWLINAALAPCTFTLRDYVYVMQFKGDKISHMTKIWNDGLALKQVGWVYRACWIEYRVCERAAHFRKDETDPSAAFARIHLRAPSR